MSCGAGTHVLAGDAGEAAAPSISSDQDLGRQHGNPTSRRTGGQAPSARGHQATQPALQPSLLRHVVPVNSQVSTWPGLFSADLPQRLSPASPAACRPPPPARGGRDPTSPMPAPCAPQPRTWVFRGGRPSDRPVRKIHKSPSWEALHPVDTVGAAVGSGVRFSGGDTRASRRGWRILVL